MILCNAQHFQEITFQGIAKMRKSHFFETMKL